jgi:hypothetical protein
VSSLGLPLACIVFTVLLGHHASQAGAKIGPGLGGMHIVSLGFAGFFLGAIFLVLAFAILRNAPRPSLPPPGVPE